MTVLLVLGCITGSLALGVLLERYAPAAGAGLLPETPPEVVAWREQQDRLAEGQRTSTPLPDRGCECPPCPGRGNDGHGMTHCAECCFGTRVEAEIDCPVHGTDYEQEHDVLANDIGAALAEVTP